MRARLHAFLARRVESPEVADDLTQDVLLRLGTMSFGEVWGFGADEKQRHRILGAFADAGGATPPR